MNKHLIALVIGISVLDYYRVKLRQSNDNNTSHNTAGEVSKSKDVLRLYYIRLVLLPLSGTMTRFANVAHYFIQILITSNLIINSI